MSFTPEPAWSKLAALAASLAYGPPASFQMCASAANFAASAAGSVSTVLGQLSGSLQTQTQNPALLQSATKSGAGHWMSFTPEPAWSKLAALAASLAYGPPASFQMCASCANFAASAAGSVSTVLGQL